jgi:hypothetical protein
MAVFEIVFVLIALAWIIEFLQVGGDLILPEPVISLLVEKP